MFKHLIRLIWNRKGENALVLTELVTAFLVVFFIAAMAVYSLWLARQPLGFDWQDTWELRISTSSQEWQHKDGETLRRVLATLRGHPRVEWAHVVHMGPFRNWNWTSTVSYEGLEFTPMWNSMSDGGPQDLGVELLSGRWFGPEDAGSPEMPVLINERLAGRLFGHDSPLGKDIRQRDADEEDAGPMPVIGVFRDFRQRGDLHQLTDYVLGRHDIESEEDRANALLLRVTPGTTAAFEETLTELIERTAPEWRVMTTPLAQLRQAHLREKSLPLYIGATIGAFLLVMVAFGLFGVLWQNVTRRTNELGLRRAVGATRSRIYRQIVGEMALIAAFAIVIGTIIAIQFPMIGMFRALDWRFSGLGMAASALIVLGLCALCALYPARIAARRSPADALHYD